MTVIHNELRLVCGVGPVVGDTSSAEHDPQVLDLLLTGIGGFALTNDGWIPGLPQLKSGGAWADSALADGRALVSEAVQNVTESMTLTATGATLGSRRALERKLMDFARLTRDFWTTGYQIEPVYLRWWAAGAPGPQYALIYNIDVAQAGDPFEPLIPQTVTITVEREPYWRGIPPGANPKLWTFEAYGLVPGLDYGLSDLFLWSGSDHLRLAQVTNKQEFWPSDYLSTITKNWLDIDQSLIPGDAPALVFMDMDIAFGLDYLVARSTKPPSLPARSGTPAQHAQTSLINAGDATMLTDATKTTGTIEAVISNGSATTGYYAAISFATATLVERIRFGDAQFLADINALRGTYALFVRLKQNGGAAGNISVQLRVNITTYLGIVTQTLATITTPAAVVGAQGLIYFGTVSIPFNADAINSLNGYGLEAVDGTDSGFYVSLYASRSTGAATLSVVDLVMMPYDEAMVKFVNLTSSYLAAHDAIDTTGYLSRGKEAQLGVQYEINSGAIKRGYAPGDVQGSPLTLLPGVNNRLYFLSLTAATALTQSAVIRLNIVPRWSGVRDDPALPLESASSLLSDDAGNLLLDDNSFVLSED